MNKASNVVTQWKSEKKWLKKKKSQAPLITYWEKRSIIRVTVLSFPV